jgi:hypothetical protein
MELTDTHATIDGNFASMVKLTMISEQSNGNLMTGQQIFDKLQWAAHIYGPGSVEFMYGNLLFEALRIHGEERIFTLLEEAEMKGKRIDLHYPTGETDSFQEAVLILT